MVELAYALSLGSNLGDRIENLRKASEMLQSCGHDLHFSQVYETPPMYVTDQPKFLNMAVTLMSFHAPTALLKHIKDIEQGIGRQQSYRHGPRLIDIDIILCSSLQVEDEGLIVPHASFREREFVLRPLAEIAPQWVDPQSGMDIVTLLRQLPDEGMRLYSPPLKR